MTLAVMLQGTASDVGKSVLVAGLCRIFHQDGLRTAPFKSQNMALNSGITPDGKEMGRAQIFQAEAAGIAPDVRMNPILLKPTSDRQAQVVLMGQVATSMDAVSYHQYKPRLREQILAVYQSLAGEYEALVLEGAGSPAEINLRDRDIVNMGMAEMAQCPVILVADIDRGGVFAAIYGTLALLQPQERARVKGVIINKFRGDVALLRSGIEQIEALTGVPVLGVMPWLDVDLEDEDGVALQAGKYHRTDRRDIDIAVVHLPHIANFTDFNALAAQPDVRVRYVRDPQALADADLVILPGSKNTLGDLCWLRESGMAHAVEQARQRKVPLLGICGGYQMLGEHIRDPLGVETDALETAGLGLLPLATTFAGDKQSVRTHGRLLAEQGLFRGAGGLKLACYEIHMGRTRRAAECRPQLRLTSRAGLPADEDDGAIAEDGWIAGTYLHGFFDDDALRHVLLNNLADRKGESRAAAPARFDRNADYDRLAAAVRASLNMSLLREIIGLPPASGPIAEQSPCHHS